MEIYMGGSKTLPRVSIIKKSINLDRLMRNTLKYHYAIAVLIKHVHVSHERRDVIKGEVKVRTCKGLRERVDESKIAEIYNDENLRRGLEIPETVKYLKENKLEPIVLVTIIRDRGEHRDYLDLYLVEECNDC